MILATNQNMTDLNPGSYFLFFTEPTGGEAPNYWQKKYTHIWLWIEFLCNGKQNKNDLEVDRKGYTKVPLLVTKSMNKMNGKIN